MSRPPCPSFPCFWVEALHWIFCFFSSVYVQFSKTSPLKSGESSEKSSGENRVKSCHVCGCHGFFGPDFSLLLHGFQGFGGDKNSCFFGGFFFTPKTKERKNRAIPGKFHVHLNQRAPNPPEFAQPRLSRVKARSSPARGYKFECVCYYMAGHEDAGVVTGHIGTNTPKFVLPRWG